MQETPQGGGIEKILVRLETCSRPVVFTVTSSSLLRKKPAVHGATAVGAGCEAGPTWPAFSNFKIKTKQAARLPRVGKRFLEKAKVLKFHRANCGWTSLQQHHNTRSS